MAKVKVVTALAQRPLAWKPKHSNHVPTIMSLRFANMPAMQQAVAASSCNKHLQQAASASSRSNQSVLATVTTPGGDDKRWRLR